ncbi:MAG TPA: DUF1294 domain-containing protein [Opitutaceae bacterium]|nr:DUF1294 domain-containing protein [Opitutaceae bacterium]
MASVAPGYNNPAVAPTRGSAIKLSARIVEWDKARGTGALQFEGHRIILFRESFVVHHKRPEVGDIVEFRIGKDGQGRVCALEVEHHNDGGRIRVWHLLAVAVLLAAPGWAGWQLIGRNDWRLVAGCAAGMSIIGFLVYWLDKLRARHGQWRVAETTLHLIAALGGWPGAFLAQKHFRHKTAKLRFQLIFWLIVTAHQFIAIDYLRGWVVVRAANAEFMRVTMPARAGK